MAVVVAAASPGSPKFAVINFGNTPPTVAMTAGFDNGNIVDCYGTLAAVAENSGLAVALFDMSVPSSPVRTGTVTTGFQIGSISIDGSYVVTGEYNGSRVSLIDVSNPADPYVRGITDWRRCSRSSPVLRFAARPPLPAATTTLSSSTSTICQPEVPFRSPSCTMPGHPTSTVRPRQWPTPAEGSRLTR